MTADACGTIAELEILADGLHIILTDPYNAPKLKVRYPHSSEYKEVQHWQLLSVIYTRLAACILSISRARPHFLILHCSCIRPFEDRYGSVETLQHDVVGKLLLQTLTGCCQTPKPL